MCHRSCGHIEYISNKKSKDGADTSRGGQTLGCFRLAEALCLHPGSVRPLECF